MRKLLALAGFVALAAAACTDTVGPAAADFDVGLTTQATGNGMESGAHYNLNIIGVKEEKTANMDDNNGHRIFVKLYFDTGRGKNKTEENVRWEDVDKRNTIILCQSGVNPECIDVDGFEVLDANATDDDGAMFALPAPGSYKIYARALGKPGGTATMRTCGWETYDELVDGEGDVWCSIETLDLSRDRGKPKLWDATSALTQMTITVTEAGDPYLFQCLGGTLTDGTGVLTETNVEIFDPCFEEYFWNYDNKGLKLLQLRFYPI
jgi:hypothetical protein